MTRLICSLLSILLALGAADAHTYGPSVASSPPATIPFTVLQVLKSQGQSWCTNYWADNLLSQFGPQNQTLLTPRIASGNYPSGLLPTSAGIFLPAFPSGIGNYGSTTFPVPGAAGPDTGNVATLGRVTVLSQQIARQADGKPLIPILEYNGCVPSSDWNTTGPGGGLQNTSATFTYAINNGSGGAGVIATLTNLSGTIIPDEVIPQATASGTTLTQFLTPFGGSQCNGTCTGTGTNNGTYAVSISQNTSGTGSAESYPWWSAAQVDAAIQASVPNGTFRVSSACFSKVEITQGGNIINSAQSATIAQFTAWEAADDGLNLPLCAGQTGLYFYFNLRPPLSTDTAPTGQILATIAFARANANGRTIMAAAMYPYQFETVPPDNIPTNIHTGSVGTDLIAQLDGLAMEITEDQGALFTPLWISLTKPVVICTTCNPQTITVPFDRPAGKQFASGAMSFYWSVTEGIQQWSQQGFDVKVGSQTAGAGTDCPVTPSISGMNVVLTVVSSPCWASGQYIEESYAAYGPGGTDPGNNPGVGGNLQMQGPPSGLFPVSNPYIRAFAIPHDSVDANDLVNLVAP